MTLTGNFDSPSSVATEGSKKAGNEAAARIAANHGNNGLDRRMGGNFKGNMEMEFYPATFNFLAPRNVVKACQELEYSLNVYKTCWVALFGLSCSC